MLGFASSFFIFNECYICGKKIKEDLKEKKKENKRYKKYICNICYKKLEKYSYKNVFYDVNKVNYIFMFSYENYIRKLILKYKFFDKSYLGNVFTEFIIRNKKICKKLESYDIIIPVPMSKNSKRKRGYNQTEIISKKLAKFIGINYKNNLLIKVKDIKRQSTLNKIERQKNVINAFCINEKYKKCLVNYKKVILFDDVYTTGATVNECLKLLIKFGVEEILVLILAKD